MYIHRMNGRATMNTRCGNADLYQRSLNLGDDEYKNSEIPKLPRILV